MSPRAVLVVWFGIGVALATLYLLRRDLRSWQLPACAFMAFAFAVWEHLKHRSDPFQQAGWAFGFFAFMVAVLFRDVILPVVSERLVLALSLIFWYGLITLYPGDGAPTLVVALCSLPTAASLYVAFARPHLGFWSKLLLYSWYLVMVVALGALTFPFGNLSIFDARRPLPWLEPIDGLATGMAFSYLATNATYLFLLVPLPSRGQSFAKRMEEWHELTDLMTQRCDDDGPTHAQALAIIAFMGGALLLNGELRVLPASLAVSIAVIVTAVVLGSPTLGRQSPQAWRGGLSN